MNKSLRNIHGSKNRSSSTTFISLHFNKADEEQLEISYGEKSETTSEAAKREENVPEAISSTENKCVEKDASDNEENWSKTEDKNSRESTPARDSVVKEYWSRISKRASSVDSDIGIPDKSTDPNEGWMFFKDIKGKLSKTLEERKSSVSKPGRDEKSTSESDTERKPSIDEADPDRTPTETAGENSSIKLSPAIEASEVENEDSVFAEYIDDKLERAKCEIISTKTITSSSSSPQFYLKQPPKPCAAKMDISMTLSTLMANRQPSMETDMVVNEPGVENSKGEKSSELPKIKENASLSPKLSIIQKENELDGLSVQIKRFYLFIKTYWNTVIFRILVGILALFFAPVPSWICGFITGAVLSGYLVYFLFKPGKPKEAFVVPDFSQIPPSNIPVMEVEDETIIYKVSNVYSHSFKNISLLNVICYRAEIPATWKVMEMRERCIYHWENQPIIISCVLIYGLSVEKT